MLVQDFLQNGAARWPDKVALICGSEQFTYAQLDAMANRLANALREQGVRRGDRVGIHLNNSVQTVVAIFGALKADAVFVAINRPTKPDKLLFILNNCQAASIITDSRAVAQGLGELLRSDVGSLRGMVVCGSTPQPASNGDPWFGDFASIQTSCPPTRPRVQNIDLDLACLIYTSGTTGEPKGVMCDHSNVVFVTQAIVEYLENTGQDVILNVLPMAFSYGLYQLLATFCTGATLVLEESFAFPAVILQKMVEHHISGFAGVPTIYSILLGMDLGRVTCRPCAI
jgi:long-chain acyl-CoA synthetase